MTNINIPPEAVEKALEAFAHASGLGIFPDDEKDEEWREDLVNGMTAAIRAALAAWPGMELVFMQPHRLSVDYSKPAVILPLTENPDAEA